MNNKLRSYTKDNPEKLEFEAITSKASIHKVFAPPLNINVDSRYIKPESYEDVQSFIVIFSGGEVREKDYFQILSSNVELFPNFRHKYLAEPNFNPGGEPRIFDFAEDIIKRYKSSQSDAVPDRYYIISDVDHFYQSLVENQERCKTMGASLIISNPCFEVWLYYSKFTDPFVGCPIPQDDSKLSQAVKSFYNRSGTIQTKSAILDIVNNIENAKANYQENEQLIPVRFSTNMYRFAEEILPFISAGISKIKKDREERIAQYKSQNKK